ncbi:putative bifunctional diguanylate cyclase/phosphodiesterase [Caldalkalibacillus mannanilyticus]|uniref:putative bifunctional diguanylate cyclase/phosphodiesterase n=1 Tax=Caldalkalibacillus mannanilyticus TaxID=1418 RepID=UPI000469C4B1|nr:bifunctional diguanylate cyclase/phosphodiesterase [Caldalkalibacillus mannanilyticus]
MNEVVHSEIMIQTRNQILHMLYENRPLREVLTLIHEAVEQCFPDGAGSIALHQEARQLAGSGIVQNLTKDSKIDSLKTTPFLCWSQSILSPKGTLLGTFSLYSKEWRSPTPQELEIIDQFIIIASIAIDYKWNDEKIALMIHYDSLTGLPNSTSFSKKVSQAISFAKPDQRKLGVMFIDLNRFSVINNLVGYSRGDDVLNIVAERFNQCIPSSSTLARWNSDKFVCLIQGTNEEQIHAISKQCIDALATPILVDEHEFVVSSSIGISLYPDAGEKADLLIKNAEIAMKHAKKESKSTYTIYNASMNDQISDQLLIEKGLREALKLNQFFLCYQPQIDILTNEIIGMEALIRWNHPTMGIVSPVQFIPIAEETGLIIPIGEWVIRTACQQMLTWHAKGYTSLRLSVNISGVQLHHSDLVQSISSIIEELQFPAQSLVLEVTESTLMNNIENTNYQLSELKKLGITISLDDFGTLYSSLNYLKNLPLDILKIDRSFIRDILSDEKDLEIVKTIIQLGHSLKMKVLAEGVEDYQQFKILQTQKCDEVQGYYFSKPLTVNEVGTRFLSSKEIGYIK